MCECLHVSSSRDQLLLNTSADNAALSSEEPLQSVCSSLNGLFQCCLSASVYLSYSVFVTSVFSIILLSGMIDTLYVGLLKTNR